MENESPKRLPLSAEDCGSAKQRAERLIIEELSGELASKDSRIHGLEEDNARLVQANREMIAKCHAVAEENRSLRAELEREACAEVAEARRGTSTEPWWHGFNAASLDIAAAIRARKEKP